MNRKLEILENRANHFHLLAMEAALAGNGPRARHMAAEADRAEKQLASMKRHPSTRTEA